MRLALPSLLIAAAVALTLAAGAPAGDATDAPPLLPPDTDAPAPPPPPPAPAPAPPAEAPDTAAIADAVMVGVQANLAATQAENLEAVAATMHPASPVFQPSINMLQQVFAAYDLRYEILDSAFVGVTGDYAVVRVTQKTTKVAGPEFRDNVLDSLHVFRRDGAKWKLWQTTVLEISFVDGGR